MNRGKKGLVTVLTVSLVAGLALGQIGLDNQRKKPRPPQPTPTPIVTLAPTPVVTPKPTILITPSPAPTPVITQPPIVTPPPTVVPTVSPVIPTPAPSVTYTFSDEFSGTVLSSKWQHNYSCCGSTTMDRTLSYLPGDGYLHQKVQKRSDGKWYADLIDTKNTFTQTYGFYEARMKIVEGKGFWPAFWLYNGTFGTDGDEIDIMEICANPNGLNGGNDVTLLHQTVHKGTMANQIWSPKGEMGASLASDWHVYGVDWRPTYIAFYLDGKELWRESSMLISTPKAVLLNFGVGGSWCSAPDATTPVSAEMLTDWVHVRQ